jgi:hypothetical protein
MFVRKSIAACSCSKHNSLSTVNEAGFSLLNTVQNAQVCDATTAS